MLERERVLLALDRRTADRTPVDFWAVPEMQRKLLDHFGVGTLNGLLDCLAVDIREVWPRYVGPKRLLPDGTFYSVLGAHLKRVENAYGAYHEYASYPLADCETPEAVRGYARWPDAAWYDWDGFSDQIGDLHERYYVKIQLGGLFENAWALRGMERFMIDIAEGSEIPHAILRRITDHFIEFFTQAMQAAGNKIDLVYTYDDVASQQGLLMSPAMWEEYVAPYHRELNRVIHGYGKKIMYHSCGAVYPLIDRIARLPVEILNPLQPKAAGMDLGRIKAEFGDRLCFHGAVDIQDVLPHGTQSDVREAVRSAIQTLGAGGGFILSSSHYTQADTPVENVLAMYDPALRKNGGNV